MEEDHYLNQLLAQLDDLTQKILEVDVQCKRNDCDIPPHKSRESKDNESRRVEDTLLIFHQKVNNHDRVMEEMKENV